MSINRLAEENSPYLLSHKDNPVHWYAWGQDAFREAEATGKPILLSIGYSACHWCHVMNRESFSDTETAALMNEKFINVKLDRAERPDIDRFYQTAAQMMGFHGGWPLTVFMTPKGAPYFVGGYFPKNAANNQPGFQQVLNDISGIYQNEGEKVAENSTKIIEGLKKQWSLSAAGQIDPRAIDIMAVHTGHRFDVFYGGLTGEPKFPHAPAIEVLWRGFLRSGAQQFAQLTEVSLHNMCMGGIYDHIGGGFHRYSLDERWMVPHFEKMASDNASLVDILTLVGQHDRSMLYRTRVEETLNWLTREMQVDKAFATSLDADTDGIEGNFYTWSEAEVDAALNGTFAQRFKEIFAVRAQGPVNGRNVLQRLAAPYPLSDADEAMIRRQRELLYKVRTESRTKPMRDDLILADINGMVIHAFAFASMAFANPAWLRTAIEAFDFVVEKMNNNGRLVHSWRDGKAGHTGFAADYAQMSRAALILLEATSDTRFLEYAKSWTHTLNTQFSDTLNGGYFETATDDTDTPLPARMRTILDQAAPSANGVMIDVLSKLSLITGESSYQEQTGQLISSFAMELQRSYVSMSSYLNHLENVLTGLQIVIVGPRSNGRTQELIAAVTNRSLPTRLLLVVDPSEKLPEGHPAFGKQMENGQPTAYICQHKACMAPITDPATLSQVLLLPARPQQGRPQ